MAYLKHRISSIHFMDCVEKLLNNIVVCLSAVSWLSHANVRLVFQDGLGVGSDIYGDR